MRFTNDDVMENADSVIDAIYAEIKSPSSSPPPHLPPSAYALRASAGQARGRNP
ncbi:MAG: hypothetical protein AB7H77_04210 [Bdellovibrionales bacterium]